MPGRSSGEGADRAEPPATPNQIAWLESGLAAPGGTGLSEADRLSVILLVGGFVRSEATLVTDVNAAFRAAGATPVQAVARYGRLLADLTSPDDSPALHAVIEARAFEHDNPDGGLTFGLERVLDVVAQQHHRRQVRSASPHRYCQATNCH